LKLEFHAFIRSPEPFFTIALWTRDWTPQIGMTIQLPVGEKEAKEVGGSGLLDFEVRFATVEWSFQKLEEGDHPKECLEAFIDKIVYVVSPIRGTLKPLPERKGPSKESSFHHNDPKPAKKGKKS
jgi:hypothetical protein